MAETDKNSKQEKKIGKTCLTLFAGFILGNLLLVFLLVGGVSLAASASGLVQVPVLSNILRPPKVEEDFSYNKVSTDKLERKLKKVESAKGKVDITLTDDEVSTLFSEIFNQPDSSVREVVVKFDEGILKANGMVSISDIGGGEPSPFYIEAEVGKETNSPLNLDIRRVRLGSLPLPAFSGNFATDQLAELLGISFEDVPADSITIGDGAIEIKGLDTRRLGEE